MLPTSWCAVGRCPEPLYRLAVDTFGQHGTKEMIYLVGLYSLVSMTLNGLQRPGARAGIGSDDAEQPLTARKKIVPPRTMFDIGHFPPTRRYKLKTAD